MKHPNRASQPKRKGFDQSFFIKCALIVVVAGAIAAVGYSTSSKPVVVPPAPSQPTAALPAPRITTSSGGTAPNITPIAPPQGKPTPNIPNPTPNQYDPVTNQHWHAGHGHWHDGPPPATPGP